MAQSGFTPIQLFRTSTAAAVPTAGNLAAGELAINLTDEALYFKNAAGVVTLLADSSGALGTVTSVAVSGGTTGLTTSGGPITSSGTITLAGTLGVANGGTGTATAFTAGSVVFAGASGVYSQDNANLFWDNTNDRLGIGTGAPTDKLHIVDGSNAGFRLTSYNNIAGSVLRISSALGSLASPLPLATDSDLFGLRAFGYTSAGTFGTAAVQINGKSAENFTATAQGTYLNFLTTAIGSATSAERMRINDAGNVGIGTASPSAPLTVKSRSVDNIGYRVLASSNGVGTIQFTDDPVTTGWSSIAATSSALNVIGGTGVVTISTAATERMRIASSGDVGIGTSAPAGRLHVVTGTNNSLLFRGPISYAAGGSIYAVNEANSVIQPMELAASSFLFTAGNVGLGVISAAYQLQVQGLGQDTAALTDAGNKGGSLYLQATANTSGSGGALLFGSTFGNGTPFAAIKALVADGGGNTTGDLAFSTRNSTADTALTERMRINITGSVGIGTSAPQNKLDIVGNMLAREDTAAGANPVLLRNSNAGNNTTKSSSALFQGTDTIGTTKNIGSIGFFPDDANYIGANLRFLVRSGDTTPTERMRIDSSGNVGIGVAPATKLDVNGTVKFSGALTSGDLADAVGYKGLPQNQRTSAYTLTLADMGKHIYATAGAFAVTIPANATTAFPIGTAITIIVEDAGKTVVPASGVTLVLAGTGGATTGTRTVAIGSVVTCIKVGTNRWFISGAGVT